MTGQRFVPLKEIDRLKAQGFPWTRRYAYKLNHLGTYPNLFLKVGGTIMVDVHHLRELLKAAQERELKRKKTDE